MLHYDYECAACQSRFEIKKSIKDDSEEHCPICGAVLTRIITRTQFDLYYPGRAIGERDGWYWHNFPRMKSVRAEDKVFRGMDFDQ